MSGSDTPDNQRGTVAPQQLLGSFAGGSSGDFVLPANCDTLLIAGPGAGVGTLTSVVGDTTGLFYPFTTVAAAPGSSAGPTYLVSVWPALDSSVTVTADNGAATWYVIADASPRGAAGSSPGAVDGGVMSIIAYLDPLAGLPAPTLAVALEATHFFPADQVPTAPIPSPQFAATASAGPIVCTSGAQVLGGVAVAVWNLPDGPTWLLESIILVYSSDGTQRLVIQADNTLTNPYLGIPNYGDLANIAWSVMAQTGTDLTLTPGPGPGDPMVTSTSPGTYAYGAVMEANATPI